MLVRTVAYAATLAATLWAAPSFAQVHRLNADLSADPCTKLTALRIPDVRVEAGDRIAPGRAMPSDFGNVKPTMPFCRVRLLIEGEIKVELWLPEPDAWTGRFYGVGNGGFAGFFQFSDLSRGVSRGFASMATDTGHSWYQLEWARGRPRAVENYAYRGMHLATVNAKAVAAAYYGRSVSKAYFIGCSGGGMQGINEASRYPADYDGIVAGAHGISFPAIQALMLRSSAEMFKAHPEAFVDADDWKRINAATVEECDAQDGPRDGILEHPERCRFDPARVAGLNSAKVETARALLQPVRDRNGEVLFDGFSPGTGRVGPLPAEATELFGIWAHNDPAWDVIRFDTSTDIDAADTSIPGVSLAGADLTLFERRGGRLISYHGTHDPSVPVAATIRFHAELARKMGAARAADFTRLFTLPGVAHCGRGDGPDLVGGAIQGDPPVVDAQHDLLSAIIAWVEEGRAPDSITASRVLADGRIEERTSLAYPIASGEPGAQRP